MEYGRKPIMLRPKRLWRRSRVKPGFSAVTAAKSMRQTPKAATSWVTTTITATALKRAGRSGEPAGART
jgi:hypothetical protein